MRTGFFARRETPGPGEIAENVAIPVSDLTALVRFAKENRVDLTVVGPDDPLAAGIVDLFTSEKLRVFGPDKSAARIESSKIFAKELMRTQKIPTAEHAHFPIAAKRFITASA
jgi:Phosphoribosylamine-glycine ligase